MPTLFGPQGPGGLLSKRIPTLVGLGILAIGVVAGVFLVGQGTGGFLPRAAEGATPKQVRITNISDTGFTVSFTTDAASPGYVKYGLTQGALNTQIADDRDQLTGGSGEFTTHHVSVRGLQPSTQYYFQIGTGSRTLFDNKGEPFAVKTATRLESPPAAQTAYGNVLNEVGNPAEGSVVYLSIQGASPLSALVKTNGSWAVPLSTIRTADLATGFSLTDDTAVRIQVVGAGREQLLELSALARDLSPLFDLRFGQEPQPPAGTVTLETTTATNSGEPSQLGGIFSEEEGNQVNEATAVQITSIEEGETISTDRPELSGTAPANSYIQIEVRSDPQNAVVQADASGNWSWTPPANLEPGSHTATIMYTDENGVQQSIVRNFIVQASTDLPAFTATPSASTPTPTPIPTPEPTPLPTPEPTPTPVPEVQQQPVSGSTNPLFLMGGLSLLFFAVGAWGARRMYR